MYTKKLHYSIAVLFIRLDKFYLSLSSTVLSKTFKTILNETTEPKDFVGRYRELQSILILHSYIFKNDAFIYNPKFSQNIYKRISLLILHFSGNFRK